MQLKVEHGRMFVLITAETVSQAHRWGRIIDKDESSGSGFALLPSCVPCTFSTRCNAALTAWAALVALKMAPPVLVSDQPLPETRGGCPRRNVLACLTPCTDFATPKSLGLDSLHLRFCSGGLGLFLELF